LEFVEYKRVYTKHAHSYYLYILALSEFTSTTCGSEFCRLTLFECEPASSGFSCLLPESSLYDSPSDLLEFL
jgi:hypothetical protein